MYLVYNQSYYLLASFDNYRDAKNYSENYETLYGELTEIEYRRK